jgi:hypothetical protein
MGRRPTRSSPDDTVSLANIQVSEENTQTLESAFASWLPARRVSTVDPVNVLSAE